MVPEFTISTKTSFPTPAGNFQTGKTGNSAVHPQTRQSQRMPFSGNPGIRTVAAGVMPRTISGMPAACSRLNGCLSAMGTGVRNGDRHFSKLSPGEPVLTDLRICGHQQSAHQNLQSHSHSTSNVPLPGRCESPAAYRRRESHGWYFWPQQHPWCYQEY